VRIADGTADFSGTAFAMDVKDIVFLAGGRADGRTGGRADG
jgi:hypothetical protein